MFAVNSLFSRLLISELPLILAFNLPTLESVSEVLPPISAIISSLVILVKSALPPTTMLIWLFVRLSIVKSPPIDALILLIVESVNLASAPNSILALSINELAIFKLLMPSSFTYRLWDLNLLIFAILFSLVVISVLLPTWTSLTFISPLALTLRLLLILVLFISIFPFSLVNSILFAAFELLIVISVL